MSKFRIMLQKRAILESVKNQLKNISQLEHTRNRSSINYITYVIAVLIAYFYREKMPSLNLNIEQLTLLPKTSF